MKAVVCTRYGPPEVLVLKSDVAKPTPRDDEVLIRIHATTVTASDALIRAMDQPCPLRCLLQAAFGFGRPRNPVLGMTLSGEVAGTGRKVTGFRTGDKVFAYGSKSATDRRFGSYAEFICLPEDWNLLPKPASLTHEQAAAVPYGGFLAWHAVKRKGDVRRGQRVLIYGASGSVGTMAVQLAKHAGAVVTAVCSRRNFDLATSLGADAVLDYAAPDAAARLAEPGAAHDLVIDAVGKDKTSPAKDAARRATRAAGGRYVSIDDGVPATAREDFVRLAALTAEGELVPVIDRRYPLADMARAHAYVDGGHKRGNVVIEVTDEAGKA